MRLSTLAVAVVIALSAAAATAQVFAADEFRSAPTAVPCEHVQAVVGEGFALGSASTVATGKTLRRGR